MARETDRRTGNSVGKPAATSTIESDAQREAVRALEMFHFQLVAARMDGYSWKWALVALHNALQNMVVAALQDTLPAAVPKRYSTIPGLEATYWGAHPYPEPRADYFTALYEHLRAETSFDPPPGTDASLERLTECRNCIVQTMPSSWTLDVSTLPGDTLNCLLLYEAMGWNPGCIRWQSDGLRDLARQKFSASVVVLRQLAAQNSG